MKIKWIISKLSNGTVIDQGIHNVGKVNKTVGPGFNNSVMAKLRKGETYVYENVHTDLKAVYEPMSEPKK